MKDFMKHPEEPMKKARPKGIPRPSEAFPIMKNRGFTLIEIAVVMAVLALLLFAAVPSFTTALANTRIRNTTESLQNGLQLARGEAVRRNQNVTLWLVTTNEPNALDNSCNLSDSSGSWVVSINSPIGHCADAPSTTSSPMIVNGRPAGDSGGNVSVTALQSDGATSATQVTFNGFGRIVNADAISRININGPDAANEYRALRVSISSAGLVRMCEPAVTNSNDPRKC
jgi:type IV fimbrial biogenesis protein FimT